MKAKKAARLARVERWIQDVIVDPAPDRAVARKNRAKAAGAILPSRTLSPIERVEIYRGQYLLRMEEALLNDYPVLEHLLGHAAFERLVAAYVKKHPSRSYSLNHMKERLPEFIAAKSSGVPRARVAVAADLARLERAVAQVFDDPATPVLTAEDARAFSRGSAARWERARIRPIAALRLLELSYPVNDYFISVKEESEHPPLRKKANWIVVFRREFRVFRLPLSEPAYRLLSALAAGKPLGAAVRSPKLRGIGPDEIFRWFSRWVGEGLFAKIGPARRS
jgi:hypothetical protein